MKRFYSPQAVLKIGHAAIKARSNCLFRKTIETEALKPYGNFKGDQVPLEQLCVEDTEATIRQFKAALGQAEAFVLKYNSMVAVAYATRSKMLDEAKLALRSGDMGAARAARTKLRTANETVRQFALLKFDASDVA
jgi:hypothetical protein